ncbi:glycerol-3-phosphate responsive antiterminator [Brucella pecoris]|uniref:Glycerol uptake operon antiterminator n=1 Tax=Brucella pecoris TaxID=867683 RepID=A0A5C5CG34_9HYPH|nr:glycerol-3-phosphate responsive antiterminator [Brucella pecoris]MBB4095774.1 glycerol uptake operon antiterminator [Brucella pecoris]TNV09696.1 glycerol-3-phosphate responsive antiterminator [Brucella pecoris]
MTLDRTIGERLLRAPVMATLYGVDNLQAFLDSKAEVGIVANIALRHVAEVLNALKKSNKLIVLNIDSCEGLSQDKGAIEFLAEIGISVLLSTRVPTIQKAAQCGLLTMQKVFVTDRSTWPRSLKAISQSAPNLVQIMPSPMLGYLSVEDKRRLPPIVASGFICNESDVGTAMTQGAIAVSSSNKSLWNYSGALRGKGKS